VYCLFSQGCWVISLLLCMWCLCVEESCQLLLIVFHSAPSPPWHVLGKSWLFLIGISSFSNIKTAQKPATCYPRNLIQCCSVLEYVTVHQLMAVAMWAVCNGHWWKKGHKVVSQKLHLSTKPKAWVRVCHCTGSCIWVPANTSLRIFQWRPFTHSSTGYL